VATDRLSVLDGWRGISIGLVMAAHLLPLGPKFMQLNHVAGVLGMVIFFILSGFLITRLLLSQPPIAHFLIRRFFRILLRHLCAGGLDSTKCVLCAFQLHRQLAAHPIR